MEAAAKQNLKGVYTAFAAENLPSDDDHGTICVAARYSEASKRLADAMASRDFSDAPMGPRESKSISQQLPDPSSDAGLFQLVTAWGLQILFDQNGDVNLVAYGQAEDQTIGKQLLGKENAIGSSKLAAENLIRMFINSAVALQQKSTTAQTVKDFVNGMNEVKISRDYERSYESRSGWKPINGIKTIIDGWGAPHPVTGQVIWGTVAGWNASQAVAAIKSKMGHDQTIRDTMGQKHKNEARQERERRRTGGSMGSSAGGNLRGKTKSKDF